MSNRPSISACVVARNEADRIGDCLRSLAWCDETVVVDSHSTDATRTVCADLGARVIQRDWPGYAAQKDFAVRSASHDWVLCIDADERVSPSLQAEIVALRDLGFPDHAGWEMPRCTWYLGRWIRHGTWYPDRCLRLFDRRRGRWVDHPRYPIHERVDLRGSRGRLRADLLHYPYRSFNDHLHTIDHYTTIIAQSLHARGRRAGLIDLTLRPLAAFLGFYILRRGFLDGWRGLLLAYLHAHYIRMKYAKLLVLERGDE
jgi:glycosyltransferase involved in cell wall biosynthesis